MKRAKPALVALAFLLLAAQARAEYRTVLVQVKQVPGKVSVTIHSDDRKDRRSGASLAEAVKAIEHMTGWGSAVGVYVASDKGVRAKDLKRLTAAVERNFWLGLMQSGGEVPKHLRDHFLKREGNR